MSQEAFPSNPERILAPLEIMEFASEVIWPAVDFLYGGDFRLKAQVQKNTKMPKKQILLRNEEGIQRLGLKADSFRKKNVLNEDGEWERECTAEVTIRQSHPELIEGIKSAIAADEEDEDDDELDRWWEDKSIKWEVWGIRTFDFSNDSMDPFRTYYDLEIQDARFKKDEFLWSFTEPSAEPDTTSLDKIITKREDLVGVTLGYNECLEIRAALLKLGVPFEVVAPME